MIYLPEKVRALHHVLRVEPTEQGDFCNVGQLILDGLQIKIAEQAAPARQLEALWHEIGHVYQLDLGWRVEDDAENEAFCDRLAIIVMQVLRDNPQILQLHANLLEDCVGDIAEPGETD